MTLLRCVIEVRSGDPVAREAASIRIAEEFAADPTMGGEVPPGMRLVGVRVVPEGVEVLVEEDDA